MTAPALRLEDLQVSGHDGRVFLHIARLEVPAGQTVALRGPSGAGKSTLLHVLSGLLRPRSGRVIWGGQDIVTLSEAARARFRRQMLGLVFQGSHLFEELSALGNAALVSAFAPRAERAVIREVTAMLAAVYLQPSDLVLVTGAQYTEIAGAEGVAFAAPIAFGDSYLGAPVVGTTARFRQPSGWTAGRRAPV